MKLKKSVPKGDKKKKKELDDEISKMETDMEKQHMSELEAFRKSQQVVIMYPLAGCLFHEQMFQI